MTLTATAAACEDCGAVDDLRFSRLLTAPDVWLCCDARACRARRRALLAKRVQQRG